MVVAADLESQEKVQYSKKYKFCKVGSNKNENF